MKQKFIFQCEFCDEWFWNQAGCEEHEAHHFNLERREYLDWRLLHRMAAEAGRRCGCNNNTTTRAEFENAVDALCDFEKRHQLENIERKPNDFFR